MNEQMQSLCFLAGANSIFYGCKLLTTANPDENSDMQLFARLGIQPEQRSQKPDVMQEQALMEAVMEQEDNALFYDATKQSARDRNAV